MWEVLGYVAVVLVMLVLGALFGALVLMIWVDVLNDIGPRRPKWLHMPRRKPKVTEWERLRVLHKQYRAEALQDWEQRWTELVPLTDQAAYHERRGKDYVMKVYDPMLHQWVEYR